MDMQLVINNGFVVDPGNKIYSKLNLGIKDGKINLISRSPLKGDRIIDAEGLFIAPGFIDAHMHEDNYDSEKDSFDIGIFNCMLRMGVTTAIGGNCGGGPDRPDLYLEAVDQNRLPVNFALLVPHARLREMVHADNKYKGVSKEQSQRMFELARKYIDAGCIGISYGIRYIPGIDEQELLTVSRAVTDKGKLLSAHIRDDAANVIASTEEFINIGKKLSLPVQVSHIGSMGAYGQMDQLLSLIDLNAAEGLDISADCYPYYAFSTGIGETTYDNGFLQRYNTGYENIEIAEGEYKGKRCTKELFERLRKENPGLITIGHVMKEEEVDMAITHPRVLIGSDGFMHNLQGHPRASGTFPRVISRYVREKKLLTLSQAVEKMSCQTAVRYGLNKGCLSVGSDADIVVFDFNRIKDNATFSEPWLPPEGIEYVIVNGEIAVHKNTILNNKSGRTIRK